MELHTLIEIYSLLPLHFEESLHTHKIETLMVCFTHLLFTFSGHFLLLDWRPVSEETDGVPTLMRQPPPLRHCFHAK